MHLELTILEASHDTAVTQRLSSRLPPEWAEQSDVLIAWPYAEGDFSPWLDEVEATYGLIAREISRRQNLIIACRHADHHRHIESHLSGLRANRGHIQLVEIPYDDVWVRDTAPLTVCTPQGPKLLDFRFNGWGNKYEHAADAAFARKLFDTGILRITKMESVDFVLEGGSLETDGEHSLLTTARCLLNGTRNPELNQEQIEQQLKEFFGVQRVLWLYHGYAEGDDTDAHVDTLARFCSPQIIAYTSCNDLNDPLYAEFKAMENELRAFTNPSGEPYRLVPLPMPKPIYSEDGHRLPATYANFLIINDAVLVPTYDDEADQIALARLADCFPGREMVAIPSTPLIRQFGSIHCMTMQFPKTHCHPKA